MVKKLDNRLKLKCAAAGIMIVAVNLAKETIVSATSDADYSFVISSDWHTCQQINANYQEVYAFETASFYINICHKDGVYFYSGEAKQSDRPDGTTAQQNSIFIPAEPLDNHRGFQAKNGNVSYLVILPFSAPLEPSTLNPEEAILTESEAASPSNDRVSLTIKRNGQLVSVESSLAKYCAEDEAIAFEVADLDFRNFNEVQRRPDMRASPLFSRQGTVQQLVTVLQQPNFKRYQVSPNVKDHLATETFKSGSHFDFYRLDGKLHRLIACN